VFILPKKLGFKSAVDLLGFDYIDPFLAKAL
jgi:hypothetical protein